MKYTLLHCNALQQCVTNSILEQHKDKWTFNIEFWMNMIFSSFFSKHLQNEICFSQCLSIHTNFSILKLKCFNKYMYIYIHILIYKEGQQNKLLRCSPRKNSNRLGQSMLQSFPLPTYTGSNWFFLLTYMFYTLSIWGLSFGPITFVMNTFRMKI